MLTLSLHWNLDHLGFYCNPVSIDELGALCSRATGFGLRSVFQDCQVLPCGEGAGEC